jgi:MFS family permease
VSWRLVFLINVPLAALALWVVWRHVPESHDVEAGAHPDYVGAAVVTLGFTGVVYALIEGPAQGWTAPILIAAFLGAVALVSFPFIELRSAYPLVPMSIFRSRQFSGANATTLAVYAGLGTATFLLVVELQTVLGYSAIEAGSSLLPITLFMLALSSRFGALAQRIGPRWPMTIGPLVVAAGLLILAEVGPGDSYFSGVLPGVSVLGFGLAITVAPLTTAVMSSVDDQHLGVGSGVNNAVARVAGLLSVAVLPSVAGIGEGDSGAQFADGVRTALQISAGLAVLGGLVACVTIRKATPVRAITQANIGQPCGDPCVRERDPAAAA